mgnify:CR=1 FL=1
MKKVGLYLIITFSFYLLGQLLWILTIYNDESLFGSENLELMIVVNIFNLSGIFGLLSGIKLYQLNK